MPYYLIIDVNWVKYLKFLWQIVLSNLYRINLLYFEGICMFLKIRRWQKTAASTLAAFYSFLIFFLEIVDFVDTLVDFKTDLFSDFLYSFSNGFY